MKTKHVNKEVCRRADEDKLFLNFVFVIIIFLFYLFANDIFN